MMKKADPIAPRAPFFKCFPSNFLTGCMRLNLEQKAVYYTLIMLLYDAWEPIDDSTVKQRQELARFCGLSTRAFNRVRDLLLAMPEKLTRNTDGRLTNARFELERKSIHSNSWQIDDKKSPSISKLNGQLNEVGLNENNSLRGLPYARESRLQSPYSTVPREEQIISNEAEDVLDSEIQQICKAIGVDLRQSTKRAGWPLHWARMRTENELTVADMVSAIDSYPDRFKGDQVRSLGMFKARAIERRVARQLDARLTVRARERERDAPPIVFTFMEWFNHLKLFLALGSWSPSLGPPPTEPGCLAPDELLDKAEIKWIEQGNHPAAMHCGGARVPWLADEPHQGIVHAPTPFAARAGKT